MKILAIAWNVFRESLRDKVFFNLLIFSALMVTCVGAISTLTVGDPGKIVADIGLAAMNAFGVLMAIFLGVSLVSKEIARRTIYNVLSKPIRRDQFLLGKYLGLSLTLLTNMGVMAVVLTGVFVFVENRFAPGLLIAIGMIYCELLVIVAVALLFSTFTTATLSAIFTLSVYLLGHLSALWLSVVENSTGLAKPLGYTLYHLLPNLEHFNYKGYALLPIPEGWIAMSLGYGVAYIVSLLALAMLIFQHREFK